MNIYIYGFNLNKVLPGIRVGDCGTKFGRNGLDNGNLITLITLIALIILMTLITLIGWIQFNHVKVPHSSMLCKYTSVDKNTGTYSQKGKKQLQYAALIGGRAIMVTLITLITTLITILVVTLVIPLGVYSVYHISLYSNMSRIGKYLNI